MTVTEAAKRLGVGRPALSNLLNGRAALSHDMALRLEATFGADRTRLLELQSAADRERRRVDDRAVVVGTYAPSFLTIEARQIEEWAGRIRARDHLPVLLRRLVHASGRELRHVDFPGYDNAQRHGWDGRVEAGGATPWVPEGRSFWEFGVDRRSRAKAEADYRTRLGALPPEERAKSTFVFVTPRNWSGKVEWARGKEAASDWKAVRALDASDLEQWAETTIAPRIWLAGELGLSTEGFESLERFWNRWAEASDPPMTPAIFAPSIAAHLNNFKTWLEEPQPDRPFTVAADSREEAVAFVACLLRHEDIPDHYRDRAVFFKSSSTLRTLAQSSSPFIPIVDSEGTEREIATVYRQRHCIVVRPPNAVDRSPDAAVELLGHAAFEKALADMGIRPDRVNRMADESGRSPTVLRRRLSPLPAIRTPPWADDQGIARCLIPMVLVGAWHAGSQADRDVLEALACQDYNEVEKCVAELLRRDDDLPVWSGDQYRGVVSKIDTLFAVSQWMTARDVTNFVEFAEYVLSESDPALELPEGHRWLAGIYGRVREHSHALRSGVCETLVMLSVHGNALFRRRLDLDVPALVADLVRRLLTPFTSRKLRSHDDDVPEYGEAAPEEFLALLEEDLRQPKPVLLELLEPAASGLFDHPARTGVLWALERLAWNPGTFMRVVLILARLAEKEIDDNWANNPIDSLSAIFRSCLPQTDVPIDDRIKALEALCRRFPGVGWRICVQQFDSYQVAFPNARPRWRLDGAGAGHGVTPGEESGFRRKALDLAVAWPEHDRKTLGDLVERLHGMPSHGDRLATWDRIDSWSETETDEKMRAALREQIRRAVLTRRGSLLGLEADQRDRARETCEKLASRDPVRRHAWLFATAWVEYSAEELDEDDVDVEEREKRIHGLRQAAMREIWSARGQGGVLALVADCDGWTVGRYAACCAVNQRAVTGFLRACLSTDNEFSEKLDNFMQGFLSVANESTLSAIITTLTEAATADQVARLFRCAPFRGHTWRLLEQQDAPVRDRYWRTAVPAWAQFTESEATELIDRLLEAQRPRAAFFAVQLDWNKVETSRLIRLLGAVGRGNTEPLGHFEIQSWHLSAALDSLDGRPGVTVDEMAQLEYACIHLLNIGRTRRRRRGDEHGRDGRQRRAEEHGIPNIERRISESPGMFVRALALVFKREDDGQDPPGWRVEDSVSAGSAWSAAFRLLEEVARIPGADDDGRVDARALGEWVAEVRRLCRENGRGTIGDQRIGQLLSKSPLEEEENGNEGGPWPCRAVCDVLETAASPAIAQGFEIGVSNARGVVSRGLDEGGAQERDLSAEYRSWAERWAFDYPHTAGILERIAKRYDRDAAQEDVDVLVRKRL